jgi:uncharacterized membrane protein HdeD (DUF308 family)
MSQNGASPKYLIIIGLFTIIVGIHGIININNLDSIKDQIGAPIILIFGIVSLSVGLFRKLKGIDG